MVDVDPFHLFRYALGTVVGIYATVVTLQVLWEWWVWLSAPDRYMSLLRRYVLVQGLRTRLATFWGDALLCLLLGAAFLLAWQLLWLIEAGLV